MAFLCASVPQCLFFFLFPFLFLLAAQPPTAKPPAWIPPAGLQVEDDIDDAATSSSTQRDDGARQFR
jgi:hypothetical protein